MTYHNKLLGSTSVDLFPTFSLVLHMGVLIGDSVLERIIFSMVPGGMEIVNIKPQ